MRYGLNMKIGLWVVMDSPEEVAKAPGDPALETFGRSFE